MAVAVELVGPLLAASPTVLCESRKKRAPAQKESGIGKCHCRVKWG